MRAQYERYPYPRVPLIARVKSQDSFLMSYEASVYAAFGSLRAAVARPRILVAGAGSFEPCVVALANPEADIVAMDVSANSLNRLKKHLLRHGLSGRVRLKRANVLDLSEKQGKFDFIIATGLLHHLPDPEAGLARLKSCLAPNGVLRLMIYSRFGRSQIYRIRDFCDALNITNPRLLRWAIQKLDASHPLRVHFHLYADSSSDAGIVDGFLHACDQGFDALEVAALLDRQELVATKFLHPVGSRPCDLSQLLGSSPRFSGAAKKLDDWNSLAVMDRLRALETNFHFITCRKIDKEVNLPKLSQRVLLNPVLARHFSSPLARAFTRRIYSRMEREFLFTPPDLRRLRGDGIDKAEYEKKIGAPALAQYLENLILLASDSR